MPGQGQLLRKKHVQLFCGITDVQVRKVLSVSTDIQKPTLKASEGDSKTAFLQRSSACLSPITRAIRRPQYNGTEMPIATSLSPI